jgi:hypothetical protein
MQKPQAEGNCVAARRGGQEAEGGAEEVAAREGRLPEIGFSRPGGGERHRL